MIVSKIDAKKLDSDLHSQLWNLYDTELKPTANREELRFLLKSLAFHFSSKSNGRQTTTYGSALTGTSFQAAKLTLFLADIAMPYLTEKVQSLLYKSDNKYLPVARTIEKLVSIWSISTFVQLLSGSEKSYLSIFHKLLRISTSNFTQSQFYQGTITASMEFQNSQLLYNALLQLLNTQVSQSKVIQRFLRSSNKKPQRGINPNDCPYCNETPNIPFKTSCCKKILCYLCVVKTLEFNNCAGCNTTNFQASPLYLTDTQLRHLTT
ncbi:LAQU0S27e00122g1_1 [Lachancea quebecensis]|uniref:LAQU0S27e00122g1_1 n=1 Tax=Lachancea quebecensis TaxID=1654605 RepID=A0A0P1KYI1_9SACH|nr:LAQU0S27e00122g1_1 [Lachancea quebecensis]